MFSCEFCEISKNIFSAEHLRTTASVDIQNIQKTKISYLLIDPRPFENTEVCVCIILLICTSLCTYQRIININISENFVNVLIGWPGRSFSILNYPVFRTIKQLYCLADTRPKFNVQKAYGVEDGI